MYIKYYLLLLIFVLNISQVAYANETEYNQSTAELKKVTGQDTWEGLWNSYLSKAAVKNENKYQENKDTIRIASVSENAFVFFTKNSNPAHPSFAKVFLRTVDGQMKLSTFTYTWGDIPSYKKWISSEVHDFSRAIARKLNKR